MFRQEKEIRNSDIWKQYLPNYKLSLLDAGNMESAEKFHTDLQLIFGMLKYRGQGTAMQEYMEKHREYFSSVTMETAKGLIEKHAK